MLAALAPSEQAPLVGAMGAIQSLLALPRGPAAAAPLVLRTHRPGDLGWVVQTHGELY